MKRSLPLLHPLFAGQTVSRQTGTGFLAIFLAALLPASLHAMDWKDSMWIGLDDLPPAVLPWMKEEKQPLKVASWIWGGPAKSSGRYFFRKEFVLPEKQKIAKATLRITADDKVDAFTNGQSVWTSENWRDFKEKDMTPLLAPGENVLAAEVENADSFAGLLAVLEIRFADGSTQAVVSDSSWQVFEVPPPEYWNAPGRPVAGGRPATELGKYGVAPWKNLPGVEQIKTYLPAAYLRKNFTLDAKPAKAVLYVTALGDIEPFLNGQKASNEFFTPGWSDYRKRLYYRSYDVSGLLRQGENTLGGILGDGWFRGNISRVGQNVYGTKTRARMELHLTDADGKTAIIGTGPDWKASDGPILEGDFQAGETYDARLEMPGWDAPEFDDSKWKAVSVGAEFEPRILEPHPAPPVRAAQELAAKSVTEPKPGVYVFDFGQNFHGWVRLAVEEPAGTPVVLRFAEMLQDNGMLYRENLRTARATDTYVTRGSGLETWEPQFTGHGFRYVEVTGLTKPPTPGLLTGVVAHTDLPVAGGFECSDALINQIYQNTFWGQRSNYVEVPTDCPQRDERLGWSGDTQVFARTGLYNMASTPFLRKWLRDLNDGQRADGTYLGSGPSIIGEWGAGWSDAGIVVPYEIWRATGDTSVIREFYEGMKKFIAFDEEKSPGFVGPDFGWGDWLAIGPSTPKSLVSSAYFAHSANLLSRMAGAIGKKADAARYAQLFDRVREVFQKNFVHPDGAIGSDSQTSYLLALRFDLLTSAQRTAAAEKLADAITKHPDQMCGFLGINLLLPTLSDIGRPDLAYALLQKRTYPGWGYSIDQGATTMWERWNSYTKDKGFGPVSMNSFNHYAYGACVEWFYSDILGIEPEEPGYGKIRIRPRPSGGLSWARGFHESPRGRIVSDWKIEGGRFIQTVIIPAGTTATLWLPAADAGQVKAPQVARVRTIGRQTLGGSSWTLFELPAGTFTFECPYSK